MKKQFTMVPNDGYHGDIVRVTKYEDDARKESFCVLDCEVNSTRAELEKNGWIYSVDVSYLHEQIKGHQDKITELRQMIKEALGAGNYILDFDKEKQNV